MAMTSGPDNLVFDNPVEFLFTDGSAVPTSLTGWEVHITYPDRVDTKALWGPIVTTARSPNWVGPWQTERYVPRP